MRHTVTYLAAGLAFGVSCKASSTTVFMIPANAAVGSPQLDSAPVAVSFEHPSFPDWFLNISQTVNCLQTLWQESGVWPRIRIGGTTEDASLYDENLPVAAIQTGSNSYLYGPQFLQLAASYGGKVVLGLNRGGNNLSNTIAAARAAKALMSNLYAVELGNEPTAVSAALGEKQFIQAGNFILEPAGGSSAMNLFALETPSSLQYIKDFSHHNYPQTVATGTPFPSANLTSLMSHVRVVENVAL